MDHQKLIEQLRADKCELCPYDEDACMRHCGCWRCEDAANAIETLLSELHEVKSENARLNRENFEQSMLIRQLEAERDAAVKTIENELSCQECKHANVGDSFCRESEVGCKNCLSANCPCCGCDEGENSRFEWRGLEGK